MTIGVHCSVTVAPATRDLPKTIRAEEALYTQYRKSALAADLELIQRGAQAPALERYLPMLPRRICQPT